MNSTTRKLATLFTITYTIGAIFAAPFVFVLLGMAYLMRGFDGGARPWPVYTTILILSFFGFLFWGFNRIRKGSLGIHAEGLVWAVSALAHGGLSATILVALLKHPERYADASNAIGWSVVFAIGLLLSVWGGFAGTTPQPRSR